jgi:hypothetical protein
MQKTSSSTRPSTKVHDDDDDVSSSLSSSSSSSSAVAALTTSVSIYWAVSFPCARGLLRGGAKKKKTIIKHPCKDEGKHK